MSLQSLIETGSVTSTFFTGTHKESYTSEYVVYESQVGGCIGTSTNFPLGYILGVDYQAGTTMTQSFSFSSPSGTLISTYSK